MRFLLGRLLHSVFLLLSVSIISFLLLSWAPGDYFDSLRLNPKVSPHTIGLLRARHGLGEPIPVRYWRWIEGIARGDWGFSLAYEAPAAPIIWARAKNTLLLTAASTLVAWVAALAWGVWAAARVRTWADVLTTAFASTLLATPELVLALLLLLVAVRTGWFPIGGMMAAAPLDMRSTGWAQGVEFARHLILPGLCLAAGTFPMLLLHVRAAVREAIESPYVTAARSHGISQRRLLMRHAFPVAASPLLSLFGLSLGTLISSSLLIETVFSWPGLGQQMVEAILQRDFFLVVDAGMLSVVFVLAGNLVADVFLYAVDPRIRAE